MEIKFGLISADSHVVLDRDAFTRRMSKDRWGDLVPHVVEVEGRNGRVERWSVHGEVRQGRYVSNCPIVMGTDADGRVRHPQRWEEVPPEVYVPSQRAKALDIDRVDAEVLFPNDPAHHFAEWGDPEYELACTQAYNDALADWNNESDRFIPLVMIPVLNDIDVVVREVERSVENGHRGINMQTRGGGMPDFTDPYWDPLWATCQELNVPVNVHGPAGLETSWGLPAWEGITPPVLHTYWTIPTCIAPATVIPHIIFSGIGERFPRLNWVLAESGVGAIHYAIDGCQHEWERLHLWTEGLPTPPEEIIRRQVYANYWFESAAIQQRHRIGLDRIMWESDFPHVASHYPRSWALIEETMPGVPESDRRKVLFENAARLYRLV